MGLCFVVAQYAELSGKTVDMAGGMINQDNEIVLLNPEYTEVWVGHYKKGKKICGTINAKRFSNYTFCITD